MDDSEVGGTPISGHLHLVLYHVIPYRQAKPKITISGESFPSYSSLYPIITVESRHLPIKKKQHPMKFHT